MGTRETMKILYILRKQPDELAKEMIEKQSHENETTVVLIQDAVSMQENLPGHVLALEDDVRKRLVSQDIPKIGYEELLSLIFQNDRILCW
jgi:sulfur transfer complex TusBCD TusB component (DsrH family)